MRKIKWLAVAAAVSVGLGSLAANFVAVADSVAHLAIVTTEAQDKAQWLAEVIQHMTGAKVSVVRKATDNKTPGSHWEMQRLYTRFSNWNSDPNAFGEWKFVEQ